MAIDSYRFLDFASRQVMKAWAERQEPGVIPFTPMAKPLRACTVAHVSTAGVARNDDVPFDQDGERRNPWWGDPTFREIPLGTSEKDVKLYHMHIDPRFGEADLDVVLPMRRLAELASEGVVGRPARTHYSLMGYILEPKELTLSMIPALTRAVGVPRLAAIGYPMGRPFGKPHDADSQRAVLRATLDLLTSASGPDTCVELPFVWPESPARARNASRELPPPPIVELLRRRPWLIARLYGGRIPKRT